MEAEQPVNNVSGPKSGGTRLMMDAGRKRAYLVALRASGGNRTAAAAAIAPYSKATGASKPGYSSVRSAAERDPEFAAQIQEVMEDVLGDVYEIIFERATKGTTEAVIQKGSQAVLATGEPAWITRYDNRLLLRLAARLDPEWSEKRQVEHSGTITHGIAGSLQITSADLAALSESERRALTGILHTIRDARRGDDAVPALEYQPGEVLDADFEEIDNGDTLAALNNLEASE